MKNIYPITIQETISDCGPACLQMLLKYYGGFETLENIRELCQTKKEGTSLYNLKKASTILGLKTNCFKVEDDFLNKKTKIPFIAHVKENGYYHYIVVYKIDKNITIVDPKDGIVRKVKKDNFKRIFTNNILIAYKKVSLSSKKKYSLNNFSKEYVIKEKSILKKISIFSVLILFLETFFATSFYLFIKIENLYLLQKIFILSFILLIIKYILEYIYNLEIEKLKLNLELKVKQNIWKDILISPYMSLIAGKKETLILSLRQTEEIITYFIEKYLFLLIYFPSFIIFYFILIKINLTFIIIPLYFILENLIEKNIIKKNLYIKKDYQQLLIEQTNKEIKISENIEEIKNMNLEEETKKYISNDLSNFKLNAKKYYKSLNKEESINNFISKLFMLSISVYLIFLLKEKILSLELIILSYQILAILEDYSRLFLKLKIKKSRIKILIENLNLKKEKEIRKEEITNIELKNVKHDDFKYINNINLKIRKKDKILLRGKSGIGKSTLLHIIKGDIKVNNIKINNEEYKYDFNKQITYVSSKAFLLNESVLDNIIYKRKIKEEELNKIIDILNLNELKERLDIENLSSGERQKVNLARALLNDTDVLLLDESLNQISEEEEFKIIKSVINNYKNKIILVVTHRENLNSLFNKKYYFTTKGQLKKGWYNA